MSTATRYYDPDGQEWHLSRDKKGLYWFSETSWMTDQDFHALVGTRFRKEQEPRYMDPEKARQTLIASKHTTVVYFDKKDGSLRRMVCRYFGNHSRSRNCLTVWDLDLGQMRSVPLGRVRRIIEVRSQTA